MKRTLALLFLITTSLFADDVDDSRRVYKEALEAYEKKDFAAYLTKVRQASDLRPSHPALLLRYAAGLARSGDREGALSRIERVASMGVVSDALTSDDFVSLRELPRFAAALRRFEANARPIGQPRRDFTIDRLGLIPEGLAYDGGGKRWFVSSVRTRTIFAIGANGEARVFSHDLPWGAFGMVFDATRNVLWVTTSALPQVEGLRAEDAGKSALLEIDGRTGRVLDQIASTDAGPHHFNDVTLAPDGIVYVSDGASPRIYRLRGKSLEPFVTGPFQNLQGLAVLGSMMIVSDYAKGLFAIDLRTRDLRLMPVPPDVTLLGVDGLCAAGPRTLVATQNGISPNRVVRIRLGSDGQHIESVETLVANVAGFGDPTLGVMAGGRFFFNANAQWDLFGEDGTISDPVKLAEALIMSVALR